jgi:hypothetical protein
MVSDNILSSMQAIVPTNRYALCELFTLSLCPISQLLSVYVHTKSDNH